ncbi:MAG: hypothetical protein WKF37_07265 [Bryobacteraceae bacterium]
MKALTQISLYCFTLNAAELPVREVVLYRNGVGYFERAGEVPAGESSTLDFKASEMNDVLTGTSVSRAAAKCIYEHDSELRLDS